MDFIALKLREYFDWQLENIPGGVAPDDYLGRRTSVESTRYWTTIKDALYLVKISAGSVDDLDNRPDRRAWPAFAEAGCLAAEAMKTQPFDFLRNLFATLSPANTSARPELRSILLQFLTSEAQSSLSPNHPITQICQELQRDDDCQEVSRRGLQCMLDIFNSRLGPSRATTFKLLDSLATLLRRNGEFHAAMEVITELLKSCRETFGPDSDEARAVENELAHFYMSIDECDLALGHCMSVVTRPPAASQGGKPVFYQDGISAHTMEDIAEIHQRRGDMEQSIAWLERAASIALSVWGPKAVATGHIIDKMTSLQRQFGKDLLRSAKLWEAALD
jgi:tetratricopeptide (TPR) repeat protein